MTDYKKEIIIRSIKIFDIVYLTILYFITALILAFSIDSFLIYLFGNEHETKTKYILIMEILLQIILTAIAFYIFKNLLELIPFPFQCTYGYNHDKVPLYKNASILMTLLILMQYELHDKVNIIKNKFSQ